jgi:hypothetical protein
LETAGRFPWKDVGLGVGSFHGLLGSSSTTQGFEDHVLCWITTVIDDEEGFRSRAMAEEAINGPLTVCFPCHGNFSFFLWNHLILQVSGSESLFLSSP